MPFQYLIYLKRVLSGDFGMSVLTSQPVLSDLLRVFPATLELSTVAIIIGVLVGVPAGVVAGARKGGWQDQVIRVVGLFGYSVPVFWLGLVGLFVLYGKLGWVAGPGRLDVFYDGEVTPRTGLMLIDSALDGNWEIFGNAFSHLILPASILGYFSLAYIARMTRSFMIDQLGQEYVTAARIKGKLFLAHGLAPRLPQYHGAADYRDRLQLRLAARGRRADPKPSSPGQASASTSRRPCSTAT